MNRPVINKFHIIVFLYTFLWWALLFVVLSFIAEGGNWQVKSESGNSVFLWLFFVSLMISAQLAWLLFGNNTGNTQLCRYLLTLPMSRKQVFRLTFGFHLKVFLVTCMAYLASVIYQVSSGVSDPSEIALVSIMCILCLGITLIASLIIRMFKNGLAIIIVIWTANCLTLAPLATLFDGYIESRLENYVYLNYVIISLILFTISFALFKYQEKKFIGRDMV